MVNNIPEAWTVAELEALFQPFGSIESCNVILNKQTRTSKGYGFVKFFQRSEAEEAIHALNGHVVDGKSLTVKKAELGKGPPGPAAIYVSGFTPESVTEQTLHELFDQYGTVQRLKLHPPQVGKRGVAFVTYECFAEAELACNATNGQTLSTGDTIQVKLDNRTAIAAQATQGRLPGPAMIQPHPFQDQRAMRARTPIATPATRFQPYEAAVSMRSKPFANSMVQPLPNGADGNYCIFVYGVQTPQMLQQLFMPFGTVANIRMQPGKKFGFVSMPLYNEAVNSINNLNGRSLPGGITLQVRMAADAKRETGIAEPTM
eukprot:GGOE01006555.1.p1 GENE.GGOE01006555.1~~GGOE01006555.1.p1  ORF type:complete len:343 (-),score=63.32 GGOE01006555.1:769-1719(-)